MCVGTTCVLLVLHVCTTCSTRVLVLHVCCWLLTLMYNVYAVKAPLLAYNSFVEAIFILNACLLILRAHEWRADFFAPLYSARTELQLKCRFIISVFPGSMMRV